MDNTDLIVFQCDDADLQKSLVLSSIIFKPKESRTINSTAFPKVAFIKPPKVCPIVAASSSVAKLNNEANGIMARKFKTKTVAALHSRTPATMPRGTKTSRTLT